MIKQILSMCLILVACFTAVLNAEARTIKVAAVQIPLMIESPDKGLFIDLLKEIGRRGDLNFDIQVVPGKRAHKMFNTGLVQLLMPFPKGLRKIEGYFTAPIVVKRDFAFVKAGRKAPKNIEDLDGMVLGLTQHYNYNPQIFKRPDVILETALSDELNMRKLSRGRIDAFLVEERSGLQAIKNGNVENVVYDKNSPIFTSEAVIVTENSKLGEIWATQISEILSEMHADGTYKRIMKSGGES